MPCFSPGNRSRNRLSSRACQRNRARLFKPTIDLLEDRLVLSVSLQLHVPPSSSYGVNNSLVVEYSNTGSTAVPAPVVLLSADNANLWLPSDPAVSDSSCSCWPPVRRAPPARWRRAPAATIVVDFTATSSTASAVNFSLGQLATGQTINWASLKAGMQPSTIPANAWNAVFANFTANVGSTTDSYQAALDADATYLAQLGEPTNDVAQLVAYEINKANDAFSTTTLGDNVDAIAADARQPVAELRALVPARHRRPLPDGHARPGLDGQLGHHRQHR